MARIGYPIIEARADGSFVVTKHDGTGGRVDRSTIVHQLAYEMGDPENYMTPDVVADFTSFAIDDQGGDRVALTGVRGKPATDTYKVSMSYSDGWKSVGQLTISGPDALAKARLCSDIVWERLAFDGFEYADDEKLIEFVGANVCHAGIPVPEAQTSRSEVVLRHGRQGARPRQRSTASVQRAGAARHLAARPA